MIEISGRGTNYMSRSIKKGPWIDSKLFKKISALRQGDKTIIKTWSRDSIIFPEMIGFNIAVHNGKEHIVIYISEEMVGHRLGEFAPTKKFRKHGGKMAKEQEKSVNQATEVKEAK